MDKLIQLSTVIHFGPHAGKTVEEICELNPQFIRSCCEHVDDFKLAPGAARYLRECLVEAGLARA